MNDPDPIEPHLPPALRPLWRRVAAVAGVGAVWLVGLAVLVVAVAIMGAIWFSRQPAGARFSIALANRALAGSSNLRLTAERSFLLEHGARLVGPVVSVIDSSGREHRLLVAANVVVNTSWWGLLRGKPGAIDIDVHEPTLILARGADGTFVLPAFRKSGRKPSTWARGDYRLRIRGGTLVAMADGGSPDTLARGFELIAHAAQAGARWDIVLDRASGGVPSARLNVTRADGAARYEDGHMVHSRLAVRSDAGWVEARAEGPLVPRLELAGTVEVGGWTWNRIATWTRTPELAFAGGFAGGATFAMRGDSIHIGNGAFDILWRDEPMRATMTGEFAAGRLALDAARLDWRDTSFRGRIDLDPGARGAWSIDGALAGLDLSTLHRLWPMPTLDPSRIDAHLQLGGDTRGLAGEVSGARGSWREVPFDALAGRWTLAGGEQTLVAGARVAGGEVEAHGTIRPGSLSLVGGARRLDAAKLPAAWWPALGLRHAPGGNIDELTASLDGPVTSPRLLASASVREAAFDSFHVAAATLTFDGRLGPAPGGVLIARGEGARLGPARADSSLIEATIAPDRVEVTTFRAMRGDSVLAFHGHAAREGAAWVVTVDALSWNVGEGLAFESEGPLVARIEPAGVVHVQRLHVRSDAGELSASGTWGGASRETDLTLDLETLDLESVVGPFIPLAGVRGLVTGHARAEGRGSNLVFTVDLDGRDLRLGRAAARQAIARGRFARDEWRVESFMLDTGRGRLRFAGDVDWARPPDLGGSVADWNRSLTEAPLWHGELVADSLSIDALADWIAPLGGWRGVLDATFTLDGRPAAPLVRALGHLRRPGWGQATLADFDLDLEYRDDALNVRRFAVPGPDSVGPAISGVLPLRLGWGVRNEDRLPDRPISLTAYARGLDLGLVPLFLPQIAAAGGQFDVVAAVGGTPREPNLSGAVTLRDGILRPAAREEVLTAVNGRLVLVGDRLRVERMSARQGENGRFDVRPGGGATVKDLRIETYALDVDVVSGTAFASGEYVIVLGGAFHIENGLDLGGPMPLPHITGRARVAEGLFLYNFADPTRQQATQGPLVAPPWTYAIDVEAENNVWYRPSDANIEGRLRDFRVSQSADRFLMLGGIEAIRGRYFFLANAFDLETGSLFFDAAQPLDPMIDARLTTEKVVPGDQGSDVRETITLAIRGRATAPSVTLTSSPTAMSQTEIVELLTYGQLRGDSRALVAAGSQFLARQLTREFPELSQTLGDIELGQRVTEGSAAEEQGSQTFTTVGLTRYFTRDLLVRYSQVVGDVSQTTAVDYQDLTAEYRLNRLLFLSGQVTRRRGVLITSQDQTIYNLDVRARHEY